MTDARIAREAAQVAVAGDSDARIAREAVQVAVAGTADARLARIVLQVAVQIPSRPDRLHGRRVGMSFGRSLGG